MWCGSFRDLRVKRSSPGGTPALLDAQFTGARLDLRAQISDVLLDLLLRVRVESAAADAFHGLLDLRRIGRDALIAVAPARAFELVGQVAEALEGVGVAAGLEGGLHLPHFLFRFDKKLALQFIQFVVSHRYRRVSPLHAICRGIGILATIMRAMSADALSVVRGEFSMEDPWALPPACDPIRLRRATDGAAPRLATTVCTYYDDQSITFVFSSADDHIVATMYGHDQPLYEEDVVEVFLAPRNPSEYYEIEVNPVGTTFDARIESPDGIRATMRADLGWDCDGLLAAVRKIVSSPNVMTIDTVMRVPFASMGVAAPKAGEEWRANLFRVDRHLGEGDEYSAWRPSMKVPADFHVTDSFGRLIFKS
jgi:Carbohydrate-binding family 9